MQKLMFIHHSGLIGGAGVSLLDNIAMLSKEFEVKAYIPSDPDDISRIMKDRQICFETYGRRIGAITAYNGGDRVCSRRFIYRALLILRQWKYWNRVIDHENPDVVVCNSKILCWMSRLPSVRKRKSVCFVRETMQGKENRWINRVIRSFLDRFTSVVFISDYDRKKEKLSRAISAVVSNYVNENTLDRTVPRWKAEERLNLLPDRFKALYVGGVSEMKGFDLAVKAVLKCGKDVDLIAAGNGFEDIENLKSSAAVEYSRRMKSYVAECDQHNQIHMIGKQRNMSDCYAACDVLLFPMRSAHQARPAFEAGYFGKPVIIADFENIREYVQNEKNGFTVKPDDADAMAEKICWLRDHPQMCQEMGRMNQANTKEKHHQGRNCERIRNMMKELCES